MNKISVDEAVWLQNNNMVSKINPFSDYSNEELELLLDHPEEIETGCENNCDFCIDDAIRDINRVLTVRKQMGEPK